MPNFAIDFGKPGYSWISNSHFVHLTSVFEKLWQDTYFDIVTCQILLEILENPSNVIFYILLHINSTKSDSQICQVTHTFGSLYFYFCASALFYQDRDQTKTLRDTNFFMVVPEMNKSKWKDQGAKYLGFFSSRSLKTREKYISLAQFVYLGSVFIFQFLNDKIHNYGNICTNWAKLTEPN